MFLQEQLIKIQRVLVHLQSWATLTTDFLYTRNAPGRCRRSLCLDELPADHLSVSGEQVAPGAAPTGPGTLQGLRWYSHQLLPQPVCPKVCSLREPGSPQPLSGLARQPGSAQDPRTPTPGAPPTAKGGWGSQGSRPAQQGTLKPWRSGAC